MKLNKKDIDGLEIAPELKTDILELFGIVESKESELATLRAKMPSDSQKIVESVDFEKWQTLTNELEAEKQKLAKLLDGEKTEEGEPLLAVFAWLWK